ncbi:hypothetical protein NMG60_11011912 [Bertholletia excelsa]
MRPGAAPMPNFFMPMVQQGQCPSGKRGGAMPVQRSQQAVPLMQQGRFNRYPPGHGMPDVSMSGVGEGMLSMPYRGMSHQFLRGLWLLPLQMLFLKNRGRCNSPA